MTLDERALATIRAYGMLSQGDKVVVGLSGGADSVALLSFLRCHRKTLGIGLAAAHLNHQLRGTESDRDQAFCENLCHEWEIPLSVKSVDVAVLAGERRESLEVCARNERYTFFEEIRDGGKAATAHNATDNVETVLLNLARGTSLAGLCGIPPVRDHIIRPLIECPRETVERYCAEQGLSFVTDTTNLTDAYARNRIRRHVLPVLREIAPSLEDRATEMTGLLRQDDAFLRTEAAAALRMLRVGEASFSREGYLALPNVIAARVLILLLKELELPYDQSRVQALDGAIRRGETAWQLPNPAGFAGKRGGGPRLVVNGELFFIEPLNRGV